MTASSVTPRSAADVAALGAIPRIPFALPCIGEQEIESVVATLRSGWLTTGPKTKVFEEAFAQAVGARHALAVNSGTAALHLALEALGVEADDLVLVPTWTFTATAEVVRYLGAHPVFVDVDAATLNVDVAKLEERIIALKREGGGKLKAMMPVHVGGQACEMDHIVRLACSHGLAIVEDAAHAFPTTVNSASVTERAPRSRMVGSVGHATAFSFYATKTIATGEGGMVTTEDDKMAERIRLMRLHGVSKDAWSRRASPLPPWYYEVLAPGFKYNLTDIASALGLVQLQRQPALVARRTAIAKRYSAAFSGHPAIEPPVLRRPEDVCAWHLYVLRLNPDRLTIDRDQFTRELDARGVGCSVHFIPLHLQPYWRDRYRLTQEMFPVASREFTRVVSLPIYPDMTDGMVDRVIEVVTEVASKCRR
ncbi:MAG: aminotransferase class I/II-fold pyridoxal phosphate-dependent enzyme [Rhizobiales bacterium]|nr:aminotransferase class I/II-fold pyridoxal phosphate-dependent enzyme [Hyphomicrobiales bacterium]